jgi:hypothetical protein
VIKPMVRHDLGSTLFPCFLLTVTTAASVAQSTDWSSPPRFDGAGYAVLGESLASGHGYREIDVPGSPRHAHFPPGYPATLALLWCTVGRSAPAAHAFSFSCTVAAVLLTWRWFRTLYAPRTALVLGLALALNWTWARNGGGIQSEPLYSLCQSLALLAAVRATRRDGVAMGIALGAGLAACVLTRHVGVCLVLALAIELGLRRCARVLGSLLVTVTFLLSPWITWLGLVHHNTQVVMLAREDLASRIAGQTLFYVRRLPDQITGPFVEVATVFSRSQAAAVVGNAWAVCITAIMIWGWVRILQTPRRRLAGLIAFTTLALLLAWPFTEAGRFLVPLVPFLLVGATEGIVLLVTRLTRRHARDWAVAMILVASIPYTAYGIVSGRALAQRWLHVDFDAACRWIAAHAIRPGPILTRHPGELFWQTGRQAIAPDSDDPTAVASQVHRFGVAYLLIDGDRYARAGPNPLDHFVERFPGRVALIWQGSQGTAPVRIFEVLRGD